MNNKTFFDIMGPIVPGKVKKPFYQCLYKLYCCVGKTGYPFSLGKQHSATQFVLSCLMIREKFNGHLIV